MPKPNILKTHISTPKLTTSELALGGNSSYAISNNVNGTASDLLSRQVILKLTNQASSPSEYTKSTSSILTTTKCSNIIINNYGQSEDVILTLPSCTQGLRFLFVTSSVGHAVSIKV